MGSRADLDEMVKRKIPNPMPGLEPPIIQTVAQGYTTALSRLRLITYTIICK
jgi:hypothetical protein